MMTGESTASVDADLVAAVVEGDRQAFRLLYDRHAPWLTVRLSRRCADQDLVDDAVQDTFVTVWRDASRYEGRGDVAAWIWADHLEIGRLELLQVARHPHGRGAAGGCRRRLRHARAPFRTHQSTHQ